MSKKKFNPENFTSLENARGSIDGDKAETILKSAFTTGPKEYISLFFYCTTNFSLYRGLTSIDKSLRAQENHNLMAFIRHYSIHASELNIFNTYTQSIRGFYERYPRKRLNSFYRMEQKAFSEKNYENPEHKYLKKITKIDWLKIFCSLEDHFLYRSIWISLNQTPPAWFTEFKEAIEDLPNEIKNYFELKGKDLFNTNNLHSTTRCNSSLKLEKTRRIWNSIHKESIEPFENAFQNAQETVLKSSTTQDEFDSLMKGFLNFCEEIKKLNLSEETPPNLLDHIHTVNNSQEPKYLFLHKLFLVLYPTQFTSIPDWEARNKSSATTPRGSLVKEAKGFFTDEVKKFMRLY